jgi:2-polyprenyl-3-methyl-5-hydroxy-6-metoxy-1,4-benzoquinol methylase
VGESEYRVVRCRRCDLVYVNPRHFGVEPEEYFVGPYLSTIEENGKLRGGIELLYGDIVKSLGVYLYPGRLIDVGCAMGHFMNFAQRYGWQATGTECSPPAVKWAREHFHVRIHNVCDLGEARYPCEYCDAGVLIEVIEHLPDPKRTLEEVHRILRPGGCVCVTTPNFASYRSLLLQEEWAAVIPSGHLYYFTNKTLAALLQETGFTNVIELTKPASFDEEARFCVGSGKLKLDDASMAELHRKLFEEDACKVSNGRGEGLIMYAQKPDSRVGLKASRKRWALPDFEGKLVWVPEDQRVFYISNGVRYWIVASQWIQRRGLTLADDVVSVSREELDCFPEGPAIGD